MKKETLPKVKVRSLQHAVKLDQIAKKIRDEAIEQVAQDQLYREKRAKENRKERQVKFREEMKEVFDVDVGTGIDQLTFKFEDESGEFDLTVPRSMGRGRLEAISICGACGNKRFSNPIYKKEDFHPILAGQNWGWHDCQPEKKAIVVGGDRAIQILEELFDFMWYEIKGWG